MNLNPTTNELVQHTANGWTENHHGLVDELISRLMKSLKTNARILDIKLEWMRFTLDLNQLRLRNTNNVPCLILTGSAEFARHETEAFLRRYGQEKIPFVFPLTLSALKGAQTVTTGQRKLLVSPKDLVELIESNDAIECLRRLLRNAIGVRALLPYDITQPARGAMFFGRKFELERLTEEEDISFAVAGPGRIGKSSLLEEYRRLLIRNRDPRASRCFYISFYDCTDTSDDKIARHLAMRIEPTSRSNTIHTQDIIQFLRIEYKRQGGPLELLLDEVDNVCLGRTFEFLGQAIREQLCRVVLAGRGILLKAMCDENCALNHRIALIRPEPLDENSAKSLLLAPLAELGLSVLQPDRSAARVLQLTGRLPHLIQFYAAKLVNLAVDEGIDSISLAHIDRLTWDFETAQFFLGALKGPGLKKTGLIAKLILASGRKQFTVPAVKMLAENRNISLDFDETINTLNDLIINNILAWNKGSFVVANEALSHFAREMGLLEDVA